MAGDAAVTPIASFKLRVRQLKTETHALYLAARHPRTPWYAKLFVAGVVAYAFSPIDLIPDFVPVLGYLDDLILVPLGIAVAIRMIPPDVLAECRARAAEAGRPVSRAAAVVIVCVWIVLAALCALWAYEAFAQPAFNPTARNPGEPAPGSSNRPFGSDSM